MFGHFTTLCMKGLSLFSAINTINSSKWKVREEIFEWKKDLLGDVLESKKEILLDS